MKQLRRVFVVLACLSCAEREATEPGPTSEQVCTDYCERADQCWHNEIVINPFYGDIPGCIADCIELDAAWAMDPGQRYDCAELIEAMRLCITSYPGCEAIDDAQIEGRWGPDARCVDEVEAVAAAGCGLSDPRETSP